jgi:hypothetical protein
VHLVGFITKKFVTMHGQMNVKLYCIFNGSYCRCNTNRFVNLYNYLFIWLQSKSAQLQETQYVYKVNDSCFVKENILAQFQFNLVKG